MTITEFEVRGNDFELRSARSERRVSARRFARGSRTGEADDRPRFARDSARGASSEAARLPSSKELESAYFAMEPGRGSPQLARGSERSPIAIDTSAEAPQELRPGHPRCRGVPRAAPWRPASRHRTNRSRHVRAKIRDRPKVRRRTQAATARDEKNSEGSPGGRLCPAHRHRPEIREQPTPCDGQGVERAVAKGRFAAPDRGEAKRYCSRPFRDVRAVDTEPRDGGLRRRRRKRIQARRQRSRSTSASCRGEGPRRTVAARLRRCRGLAPPQGRAAARHAFTHHSRALAASSDHSRRALAPSCGLDDLGARAGIVRVAFPKQRRRCHLAPSRYRRAPGAGRTCSRTAAACRAHVSAAQGRAVHVPAIKAMSIRSPVTVRAAGNTALVPVSHSYSTSCKWRCGASFAGRAHRTRRK